MQLFLTNYDSSQLELVLGLGGVSVLVYVYLLLTFFLHSLMSFNLSITEYSSYYSCLGAYSCDLECMMKHDIVKKHYDEFKIHIIWI